MFEGGRRKPSLKLVARIADTLGLDRQEVLLLAHPEVSVLLSPTGSEPWQRPPLSWQRFTKNSALLAPIPPGRLKRHSVPRREHLAKPKAAAPFQSPLQINLSNFPSSRHFERSVEVASA